MRSIKYRDVLWAAAYRIGLDPAKEFLQDQADSAADYVNGWIRRLYDSQDWPEWTQTRQFTVPANHIIPYNFSEGVILGTDRIITIGRVFEVNLLDPSTTPTPVDTPFELMPEGIHVGYEHGTFVWIKFIPACPQFTSTPWDSGTIYGKGNLVYLPRTGECYKSRTSSNLGHDPSVLFSPNEGGPPHIGGDTLPPPPLTTEILQDRTPANPGTMQQNEIMRISLLSMSPGPDPVDPPPSGSFWSIAVLSDVGGHAGVAVHTADGIESLAAITTAMAADLNGDLTGFGYVVTADTSTAVITINGPESFSADPHCIYTPPGGAPVSHLKVVISQPFVAATAGTDGLPQLTKLSVTADQLLTGTTYAAVFTDTVGAQHTLEYTALSSDSVAQVLTGLSNALTAAQLTDSFFETVSATVDLTTSIITFASTDKVSVDGSMSVPASPWWELVQMPFVLADPIIRGEVADIFREEGQTDRSDGEEKKVETELGVVTSKFSSQYATLTTQQKPRSRYALK